MFTKNTLFILGVGASFPYGYPLGKGLITEIINNINKDIIAIPFTSTMTMTLSNEEGFYPFSHFENQIEAIDREQCYSYIKSLRFMRQENRFSLSSNEYLKIKFN